MATMKATKDKGKAELILRHYESLTPEGKEKFICQLDPYYFLTRYVQTHDPYKGIQAFPAFPYLEHTIHSLQDNRLNIFRKGRQLTFSWTFSAYGLWESQFNFAATCLYTSKRQDDSFELKDRAFFMWEHLPGFLRQEITSDNKTTMEFRGLLSKMKFLPATEGIGRSFTAGHVFMDEFAHVTCDGAKMFTSIKPTINAGGHCTIFSSPNGPFGKFYELCGGDHGPDSGWNILLENGFVFHYMPYDVHPEHDAEWEREAFRGLTQEEIDQEYRALWVKRGGKVYPLFDRKIHVCAPFDIPKKWPKFRSIDFGGANPTAVVWVAVAPTGQLIVYRTYKKSGLPIRTHAQNIKDLSGDEIYHKDMIGDHDSQNRIEYADNGIMISPAIKDFESGYNEVTRHLMVDANGNPGLLVFDTCLDFAAEIEVYSWPEGDHSRRDPAENPIKLNDHLMDAFRYLVRTTKGLRTGFSPVREIPTNSPMKDADSGARLHNPSPIHRMDRLFVSSFGYTLTHVHQEGGGRRIQRLGI